MARRRFTSSGMKEVEDGRAFPGPPGRCLKAGEGNGRADGEQRGQAGEEVVPARRVEEAGGEAVRLALALSGQFVLAVVGRILLRRGRLIL